MEIRWIEGDECEVLLNPILESRGMTLLNSPTSRALGAFEDGGLVMALVVQLYPVLGPLLRTDNFKRDNGDTARALTEKMHEFLDQAEARDYMVIANSPFTERLAQRHGMVKTESPVYLCREAG